MNSGIPEAFGCLLALVGLLNAGLRWQSCVLTPNCTQRYRDFLTFSHNGQMCEHQ